MNSSTKKNDGRADVEKKVADLWKVTNLKVLMAEKVLMNDADD